MKYRKRSIICSLLAGLTVLINSCQSKSAVLEIITTKQLPGFPSASAMEYNKGRLFLFGDDAPYLLILDTAYMQLDSIRYIEDTVYRIPKPLKPDIEAATILSHASQDYLFAIGSFSTGKRMTIFNFPVLRPGSFRTPDKAAVFQNLKSLPEINIEGFASVQSKLVLANRANTTHRVNKLLILNDVLFQNQTSPELNIADLVLNGKNVIGVSGLYYVEEKDIMLFTASEEDTPSATQDGVISDSYLGWIRNFSKKMNAKTIKPDQMINLSTVAAVFINQKIESVCAEPVNDNSVILHLAADNDNGKSRLFKMKLRLE